MGVVRLLLALSVVIAHSESILGIHLVGGKIAVQAFYIISGFYMSLILNEKYIGKNNSFRLFITNRFIRLFPIYWTVLLITVLLCIGAWFLSNGQNIPKFDNYLSVKTNILSFTYIIFSNIILYGQDVAMFLGITPANGNLFFTSNFANTHPPLYSFLFIPQAWTLGVELTFYLIAPFILRRGFKPIIVLIFLSFLLRLYIYNIIGFQNDPWSYRFFPTEVMFFLLGYISYRIYLKLKNTQPPNFVGILTLIFLLLFTVSYTYIPHIRFTYLPFSINEIFYFTFIVLSIPMLFNTFRNYKIDNTIGELSYPVYISHLTVIDVCRSIPFLIFKSGWFMVSITIIVAYTLNKMVALPLEKFRQSRLAK